MQCASKVLLLRQQASPHTSQKWFATAPGKGRGGSQLQNEAERSASCPQQSHLQRTTKLVAAKPKDSASIIYTRITLTYFPERLQSCWRCSDERHYRNPKQDCSRYTRIRLSVKCSNALSTVEVTDKRSNSAERETTF